MQPLDKSLRNRLERSLPAVTQLFTEPYMVSFLLGNYSPTRPRVVIPE